jgi:1-acyl-sn-glycerol-3-phosphate acyltransferase
LRRSSWPRRFLGGAAWLIGARVRLVGDPLRPHSLLVPNHVSWLDILVLGGATGCRFVSKDRLGHPFVHWLADQNATIYVERQNRRAADRQTERIAAALHEAQPVAVFPEGTTGPGDRLLPFRPTLLEAAARAEKEVEIRPVAIDYGLAATEVGWFEEPGTSNIKRILGRRGTLPVTIHLLPAMRHDGDRKRLAAAVAESIAGALGFKSGVQSPIDAAK